MQVNKNHLHSSRCQVLYHSQKVFVLYFYFLSICNTRSWYNPNNHGPQFYDITSAHLINIFLMIIALQSIHFFSSSHELRFYFILFASLPLIQSWVCFSCFDKSHLDMFLHHSLFTHISKAYWLQGYLFRRWGL